MPVAELPKSRCLSSLKLAKVEITKTPQTANNDFRSITDSFLRQPGLPLADVLPAERIAEIFEQEDAIFAQDAIFSTPVVLWAFLAQTLRDRKMASCGAAVKDIAVEMAETLQQDVETKHLWKGRHAKLVDGFTFTMPDTEANQAEYPQNPAQKESLGFPIARACAVLSLATACMLDLAIGPYSGKETGETALLRETFDSFKPGRIEPRVIKRRRHRYPLMRKPRDRLKQQLQKP